MAESRARFKTDDEYNYPAWKSANMSDVCEFVRNGFNYNSDGIRTHKNKITRIETISSGTINLEKLGSTDDDIPDRYLMKDGDILFSHINSLPYLGNTALFNAHLGKIYHGMNLLCIRPNSKKILPYYLFLYLQTSKIRNWVLQNAKRAVNQCSIPASEIENMPVIVPCIEEQQKISKFFLSVDEVITASEKEVANLEAQKKAVMKKIFSQEVRFKREDGTEFPEWEEKAISEVSDISGGKTPSMNNASYWNSPAVNWITSKDMKTDRISKSEMQISEKAAKTMKVYNPGTVLVVVRSGILRHSLPVAVLDDKSTINQDLKAFEVNGCDSDYFAYFLKAHESIIIRDYVKKGTTVQSIQVDDLIKMTIPISCSEEQHLIADFLSDFDEAIAAAKKELELWKELKKGLLQQMFV